MGFFVETYITLSKYLGYGLADATAILLCGVFCGLLVMITAATFLWEQFDLLWKEVCL